MVSFSFQNPMYINCTHNIFYHEIMFIQLFLFLFTYLFLEPPKAGSYSY